MEKKYNPMEYNNAVPCEVCGNITFADDYGNINGRLLKDIWDEVVHPCFMYCGSEHDYDFPPED